MFSLESEINKSTKVKDIIIKKINYELEHCLEINDFDKLKNYNNMLLFMKKNQLHNSNRFYNNDYFEEFFKILMSLFNDFINLKNDNYCNEMKNTIFSYFNKEFIKNQLLTKYDYLYENKPRDFLFGIFRRINDYVYIRDNKFICFTNFEYDFEYELRDFDINDIKKVFTLENKFFVIVFKEKGIYCFAPNKEEFKICDSDYKDIEMKKYYSNYILVVDKKEYNFVLPQTFKNTFKFSIGKVIQHELEFY